MWSRFLSFLIVALASTSVCAPARAQSAPFAPATRAAPDPLSNDLAGFGTLFKRGFYDELIYRVNQKIAALPKESRATPDARLLYFRGLCYYGLGWYPQAKADLLVAQKAGIRFLPGGFGVNYGLNYIEARIPLLPPQVEQVRDGDRVIFQMHDFGAQGGTEGGAESGTATVLATLPEAYRISSAMFGADMADNTVYVFDTYEQFTAYFKQTFPDKTPGSWYAATANGPEMWISLRDTKGVLRAQTARLEFQTTVVHEFNHALLARLIGRTALPRWFVEGLAQVAGAQINSGFDGEKQQTLKRLFANNALLPLDRLDDYATFDHQTELGIALSKSADRADRLSAPDAYAQSYGMTKSLLDNISTPQLQSLLNRARDSNDFKASFQTEFGFSLEQFYQGWKADAGRRSATQR